MRPKTSRVSLLLTLALALLAAGSPATAKPAPGRAAFLPRLLGSRVMKRTQTGNNVRFMVGGEYRSSRVLDRVVDPTTGKGLVKVYASSRKDVLDAIGKADGARAQTAALSLKQRATILRGVANQIKARSGELARVMALESGKPLADAKVEVDRAVNTFRLAAREALKLKPKVERSAAGTMRVERAPIGVVSAITPFNFPLNLVAHKVAPAIAAGNPVVIKPSPRTPLTSLLLAEMITKTAWPKAAISVVTPRVSNIAPLVKDRRVKMVSFTGSEQVGWSIKRQASDKRVALELGGNAALVVHKDADLQDAVKKAVRGAFAYSGQVCISTQRIMVHEKLYPRFVKALVEQTRQLKLGDPLQAKTQLGPMIDRRSVERTQSWLREAQKHGARVLTGGKARGNFMEPTVVVNAKPGDKIVREEAFAPLVVVSKYSRLGDALKQVNDSRFGLQAGIFTKSQAVVEQAYRTLEVGGLVVNHVPTVRFDAQPYGGIKRSGFGREGPRYALEEMTEYKTMLMPGVK
jgi:acyl-CoA reductase-like NAD-dependent aldehyde dehydrogenase